VACVKESETGSGREEEKGRMEWGNWVGLGGGGLLYNIMALKEEMRTIWSLRERHY